MTDPTTTGVSRRDVLKRTTTAAAAAAVSTLILPRAYAAEDNTLNLSLIGCGGRGTGAAMNALSTKLGPTKLVAMADVFQERIDNSYQQIKGAKDQQVDVPSDRKFLGFDAYKKAMDVLRPGDVVILTTPPAFRWVQFQYAIERGLNVFMEKPTTVDGPSTRKMLALADISEKKGLKVGVGLMCRHCDARNELYKRIQDGEIGDLVLLRAYRVAGPTGNAFVTKRPADFPELLYQVKNFHGFLWASGGAFSDFLIHNIDECCWMKNDWPVEAKGYGGRHYRGNYIDQNFDSYSVEYTFADGTKMMLEGRGMDGCDNEFASYAHGSKGCAVISQSGHAPSFARTYKGQSMTKSNLLWQFPQPEPDPYQLEWDHLMASIRENKPHNEARRGALASLVTAMGRLSSHCGKTITFEEMLNHEHDLGGEVDKLSFEAPAPVLANADGKYPMPQPGLLGRREY